MKLPKLLVIDDDAHLRESSAEVLELDGFECHQARRREGRDRGRPQARARGGHHGHPAARLVGLSDLPGAAQALQDHDPDHDDRPVLSQRRRSRASSWAPTSTSPKPLTLRSCRRASSSCCRATLRAPDAAGRRTRP